MAAWVYDQGHIGWALFGALVYTGVLLLIIDYVWRRVTLSFRILAGGSVLVWVAGLILNGLALVGIH